MQLDVFRRSRSQKFVNPLEIPLYASREEKFNDVGG